MHIQEINACNVKQNQNLFRKNAAYLVDNISFVLANYGKVR